MTDIAEFITPLLRGEELTADQAEEMLERILSGAVSDIQIAAVLSAMAARGESSEEILGAVSALRSKSLKIRAPQNAVDCCGTGGDHAHTVNISTAVSFVLAACGVPVAKHGNRASSSKSGAADVLEALGLNLSAANNTVQKSMDDHNICFLMAPVYNPAIAHVGPVRKALKARTIFNLLGPLLNPAGTQQQLIGVFDKRWAEPMAEVLNRLGTKHAWIVWGHDGLDEITTTTSTGVVELKDGQIRQFEINPTDYGLALADPADLKGGDAAYNAAALTAVLNGAKNAYRDIVLINSAAALIVAGQAADLHDGILQARRAIDDGRAMQKLQDMIGTYNG